MTIFGQTVGIAERPEDERRSDVREVEDARDERTGGLEHHASGLGLEHDQREQELQAQPPGDRAIVDRPSRRRQAIRQREDQREPRHGLDAAGAGKADGDADQGNRGKRSENREIEPGPRLAYRGARRAVAVRTGRGSELVTVTAGAS